MKYFVAWHEYLDAESPEEAARLSYERLQKEFCTVRVFPGSRTEDSFAVRLSDHTVIKQLKGCE